MAHVLEHVMERPHPCAYLPNEQASLEVMAMVDVSSEELEFLLERGWRRFGPHYFRHACGACTQCISIRVEVSQFVPSKSQRRVRRKGAHFARRVGPPRVDDARLALYRRWHGGREAERGWEPSPLNEERYHVDFAFPHPSAREAAFYDGEKLVAVSLFDEVPGALSAVYCFSDPAYAPYSLGTLNVLTLVEEALKGGRAHVYLGYWVHACPSLSYKARFSPHELLTTRPSHDERPGWEKRMLESAGGSR